MSERNIRSWIENLEKSGRKELADLLKTDKTEDLLLLDILRLPRYEKIMVNLSELLADPVPIVERFKRRKIYVQVQDINTGLVFHPIIDVDFDQNLVKRLKSEYMDANRYLLIISEYLNNLYGGTINCYEDQLYLEMVRGRQTPVAYGTAEKLYTAQSTIHGLIKYNFNNIQLRQATYEVIRSLKKNKLNARLNLYTGYFEFVIVGSSLSKYKIIFLDAKNVDAYYRF